MNQPRKFFQVSLLIACFLYGVIVGVYEYFPYKALQYVKNQLDSVISDSSDYPNLDLKYDKSDYDGFWVRLVSARNQPTLPPEITLNRASLNSFVFRWVRIEDDNIKQVSALKFKDNTTYYINRHDPRILSKLGLSYKNVPPRAGIRAFFEFQGRALVYVSYVQKNCATAKLVFLDTNETLLDLGCINFEEANLDAIGGGYLVLNENEFLLAIGTGTSKSVGHPLNQKAQDDESYWGKILKFSFFGDVPEVSVYSKGHRNPQGMFVRRGKIYSVEHGPMGGDEINEISQGNNYGWPKQSLGSEYTGEPINKLTEDILNYVDPLYAFIPSIGISAINGCPLAYSDWYKPYECLAVSSMRAGSIFFVVFNDSRVLFTERIDLGSRIRKFIVDGNRVIAATDYDGVIVGEITPRFER